VGVHPHTVQAILWHSASTLSMDRHGQGCVGDEASATSACRISAHGVRAPGHLKRSERPVWTARTLWRAKPKGGRRRARVRGAA